MGDLGGFVASATNLALSTELYLKSLWMMLGYPVPEHHKLWPLYKRLPSVRIKGEILSSYDHHNQMFGDQVAALELAISKGPADQQALDEESRKAQKQNEDSSLAAVLRRSSDAFIVWRYLHEQAADSGVRIIRYEFLRIRLVATCARTSAVSLFQGKRSVQSKEAT